MAIIVSSVVLAACGTETTNQTRVCDVIADAVDLFVDGDVTGATERVEDLVEMDTRGLDDEVSLRVLALVGAARGSQQGQGFGPLLTAMDEADDACRRA
jgi:hypothetical protein